jgi:hypothetical protein
MRINIVPYFYVSEQYLWYVGAETTWRIRARDRASVSFALDRFLTVSTTDEGNLYTKRHREAHARLENFVLEIESSWGLKN